MDKGQNHQNPAKRLSKAMRTGLRTSLNGLVFVVFRLSTVNMLSTFKVAIKLKC